MDDELSEMQKKVPKPYMERFAEIVERTDRFCDGHLNADYKALCRANSTGTDRPRLSVSA